MGDRRDIYGISKEQHKTGIKELKKTWKKFRKKELKTGKISYVEKLRYFIVRNESDVMNCVTYDSKNIGPHYNRFQF